MYTWNDVSSATWYYLWVNGPTGNVFKQWYTSAQANCAGGTCSVIPMTTLTAGSYLWRIQTYNSSGYGPWSTEMPFTVSTESPSAVITVQKSGTGTGTIVIGEQECGPDCPVLTVPYAEGSRYILQAVPAADSRFVGWQTEDGHIVEEAIFYAQPGETMLAVFEKTN
jgi:hypothetical protein